MLFSLTEETVTPATGRPDTAIVAGYGAPGPLVPVPGTRIGARLLNVCAPEAPVTVNKVGSPAQSGPLGLAVIAIGVIVAGKTVMLTVPLLPVPTQQGLDALVTETNVYVVFTNGVTGM